MRDHPDSLSFTIEFRLRLFYIGMAGLLVFLDLDQALLGTGHGPGLEEEGHGVDQENAGDQAPDQCHAPAATDEELVGDEAEVEQHHQQEVTADAERDAGRHTLGTVHGNLSMGDVNAKPQAADC